MNSGRCAIVIPCLNESAHIGPLVTAARQYVGRIYVIDDGSADDTGREAERAGAVVLKHSKNLGKGAALSSGLRQAMAEQFEFALAMDGDGQHAPEDIPVFLAHAIPGTPRLVIGNRLGVSGQMPWLRRTVNRWMSWQLSRLAQGDYPDSQCGFRLIHIPSWAALHIQSTHFEIESELLVTFAAAGIPVHFVPVRQIYATERSKIRYVRDSWRWLRWWLAARRSVRGKRL